jgi:hypothetical protein
MLERLDISTSNGEEIARSKATLEGSLSGSSKAANFQIGFSIPLGKKRL